MESRTVQEFIEGKYALGFGGDLKRFFEIFSRVLPITGASIELLEDIHALGSKVGSESADLFLCVDDMKKLFSVSLGNIPKHLPIVGESQVIVDGFESKNHCKLCSEPTTIVFNIDFNAVPVCESCARAVFIQQANRYHNREIV